MSAVAVSEARNAGAVPAHGRWPSRLLYIVNDTSFFVSHRLPLALAARRLGAEVHVMALADESVTRIQACGLTFHPMTIDRTGLAPLRDAEMLGELFRTVRRLRPTIVHAITIKPVCYGGLVARALNVPGFVAAVTGLGQLMGGSDKHLRIARQIVFPAYRAALAHPNARVIFQNEDDLGELVGKGLVRTESSVLIRGSGVDPAAYPAKPESEGKPIVLLSSRLLWEKGIGEFVTAARCLRNAGSNARFVIVGEPPRHNRNAVSVDFLRSAESKGWIEWWGHRSDMAHVYAQSSIVCLPTFYREGVPKALIEAAACGRAIVTTDAPGCRDICRHQINGLVVPERDPAALVAALATLITDTDRRWRMGMAGRRLVEEQFSLSMVVDRTLDVYRELGLCSRSAEQTSLGSTTRTDTAFSVQQR